MGSFIIEYRNSGSFDRIAGEDTNVIGGELVEIRWPDGAATVETLEVARAFLGQRIDQRAYITVKTHGYPTRVYLRDSGLEVNRVPEPRGRL